MKAEPLYEVLKNLKSRADNRDGYEVENIEGTAHKLGVSQERYPMFFIQTCDKVSALPNLVRELLTVDYNTPCTFVDNSVEEKHRYSIITLRSSDTNLQREFLDLVQMVLRRLDPIPAKSDIAREVEYLISILSAMRCPPKKKIQGLWAELLVIERSADPERLISAWHNEPSSKYDFVDGRDKLEVKSTSAEVRKHTISLDQLNPSPNSRLLIASVLARESGQGKGGLSVDDLREKICLRVEKADAQSRLFQIIAQSLGRDYEKARTLYFDYVEASDNLKFYDYQRIPKINKEHVGQGVSGVKFVSDFTKIPDIIQEPYPTEDSPLFNCLLKP